jgi:hypothetical protein
MKMAFSANLVSAVFLVSAGHLGAFGQTAVQQQNTALTSAHASISVCTTNGQTVATYNGSQVFAGPTKEPVHARSQAIQGVTYAAVFEGSKVLWESQPGAAQHLNEAGSIGHQQFMEHHRKATEEQQRLIQQHQTNFQAHGGATIQSGSSGTSISVKTVNHQAVVVYEGREIPVGSVQGVVSAKAKTLHGVNYAAAFDGERVLWENVPGAAEKVR